MQESKKEVQRRVYNVNFSTLLKYSFGDNSSSRANPTNHAADIETTVQQVYPALHIFAPAVAVFQMLSANDKPSIAPFFLKVLPS